MSDVFAAINGNRVVSGMIAIPCMGIWHADLLIDQPIVIASGAPVTIALGPLTMQGTRIGGPGVYTGSARYRIVGGKAGWRKPVDAQSYQHDSGVLKSMVLGDVAKLVGETVKVANDSPIGTAFVRRQGPAVHTLEWIGDPWHVDFDGVTQVGPRKTAEIVSQFDVQSAQLVIGQVIVATDNPQDWLPARTFSTTTLSPRTIAAVFHRIEKAKLRTEAWVEEQAA